MVGLFTRHLYVRIWLAVLAGVAVVALAAGWAWQMADEQRAAPLPRDVVLRDYRIMIRSRQASVIGVRSPSTIGSIRKPAWVGDAPCTICM